MEKGVDHTHFSGGHKKFGLEARLTLLHYSPIWGKGGHNIDRYIKFTLQYPLSEFHFIPIKTVFHYWPLWQSIC